MKLDNCAKQLRLFAEGACGGAAARPPPLDHGEVTGEIAQWIENPLR